MTPDLARIRNTRTTARAAPRWAGGDALRGTMGWYWDASGGFIPETPDRWNPRVALLVFPRITSSPRIDRRDSAASWPAPTTYRRSPSRTRYGNCRRRSRSTSPNSPASCESPAPRSTIGSMTVNRTPTTRIQTVLRLLSGCRVSASNPLFPRFV